MQSTEKLLIPFYHKKISLLYYILKLYLLQSCLQAFLGPALQVLEHIPSGPQGGLELELLQDTGEGPQGQLELEHIPAGTQGQLELGMVEQLQDIHQQRGMVAPTPEVLVQDGPQARYRAGGGHRA